MQALGQRIKKIHALNCQIHSLRFVKIILELVHMLFESHHGVGSVEWVGYGL